MFVDEKLDLFEQDQANLKVIWINDEEVYEVDIKEEIKFIDCCWINTIKDWNGLWVTTDN